MEGEIINKLASFERRKEIDMNTNEIMKMITDEMVKNGESPEKIAQVEIAIQYLGNEDFRKKLNDFVFNATYKK